MRWRDSYSIKCWRRPDAARCCLTTCPPGYQLSQRARKRVEEIFGWVKVVERCATAVLPGTRCGLSSPLLWGCRRGGGLQLVWSNQNILNTRLIIRQSHDAAESK